MAEKLGYTEGYGSFQIPGELYERIIEYLTNIGENTARGTVMVRQESSN